MVGEGWGKEGGEKRVGASRLSHLVHVEPVRDRWGLCSRGQWGQHSGREQRSHVCKANDTVSSEGKLTGANTL